MHHVTEATYLDGYRIRLRFEDESVKVVDLGPHLDGGIFETLKDPAYFRQVQLNRDIDTIVWPNEADFSPDFLYEIGKDVTEQVA